MQPKYNSIYRAVVTTNVDSSNSGKIKVQAPQIGGAVEIRAAEPANPQEPVPTVGSTVWLAFSGGDITKPVYYTNQAVPATLTSSTLPAVPFSGQLVWETDTGRLVVWDGSNWQELYGQWIDYTPTWSGLSVLGASTASGRYQVIGRTVNVVATLTGGTGTSLGTNNITFSLPINSSAAPSAATTYTGAGRFNSNNGSAWHPMWPVTYASQTTATVYTLRSSDLGWVSPGISGLTWQSGSVMNAQLTYEI